MKNRGLLSRQPISPYGGHKDPTPSILPNRQVAGPAEKSHRTELVEPKVKASGQKTAMAPDPKTDAVPGTPTTQLTKRYTLILKLDARLVQRIKATLASPDPASKSAAKHEMVRAFRASVPAMLSQSQPMLTMPDPVPYRIDIRLSDDLVGQIFSASSASPFDARSTVLARFLSPHFSAFLEAVFARSGTPKMAEPTPSTDPEPTAMHHRTESDADR